MFGIFLQVVVYNKISHVIWDWIFWHLIDLDMSNVEYRIFVVVFCRQAQWKNKNKHSKFDMDKLMTCQDQKSVNFHSSYNSLFSLKAERLCMNRKNQIKRINRQVEDAKLELNKVHESHLKTSETLKMTENQGNLLKGIDKKTVRRVGVSICLLMFSPQ